MLVIKEDHCEKRFGLVFKKMRIKEDLKKNIDEEAGLNPLNNNKKQKN
jgi:hypothetical protein